MAIVKKSWTIEESGGHKFAEACAFFFFHFPSVLGNLVFTCEFVDAKLLEPLSARSQFVKGLH